MVSIIFAEEFLQHRTGLYHPECPERLVSIVNRLRKNPSLKQVQWLQPTPLKEGRAELWVSKFHDADYIRTVASLAKRGGGRIDLDTPVSAKSYEVALLAVNAWLDGVDKVLQSGKPCFVLARPPGHHATPTTGMGFCLFANAAIAAHYALTLPEITRVGILDWDVHHGNGTQEIVQTNPHIRFCSLHQYPFYPGTGSANETGLYNNVLNIPLKAGSDIKDYEDCFQKQVIPFFREFSPDILIISAGYDANFADPLAEMCLFPADFGKLTEYCLQITKRILFGLEGGYHLEALAESVEYTILPCLSVSG
ncbi:MAG: histone deacetylase [Geminocystis sp.]|nr:histone deacetylase [Geminocystis sp.]